MYSSTQLSNEMRDPIKTSSTTTKSRTILQSLYVLSKKYYLRMEPSPYVYRPNTSPFIAHNMLKYIVPHNNLMKGPRRQRPVTPQPRPRPCYKFYMFFLIHTTTGQNQIIMYTDPISVHLLPITC